MNKRGLTSNGESIKRCRKARAGAQRRWTTEEVNNILKYMKNTLLNNLQIEKPTATAYYHQMNVQLQLKDITTEKTRAKVSNLKASYIQTLNWRETTGQGVEEEQGESSLKAELLKRCPHFEELDEIFGTKLNIDPLLIHDTGVATSPEKILIVDDDRIIFDIEETVDSPLSPNTGSEGNSSDFEKFKSKLEVRHIQGKGKPQKKDIAQVLEESQQFRSEILAKKIDIEEKRLDRETLWKNRKLDLMEKRIETEKEIKLIEIGANERIEKFRIEQEFKLKLELAKIQQIQKE